MLLAVDDAAATVFLGAAKAVGTRGGRGQISDESAAAVQSLAGLGLGVDAPDVATLAESTPGHLAAALTETDQCTTSVEILAVMALVDGALDPARISSVLDYADALDVDDDWLSDLAMSLEPDLSPVIADMGDHNLRSVTNGQLDLSQVGDINQWLMPYDGDAEDPALADRYRDLAELPTGTFGHEFWSFYVRHQFAFPGQPGAVNEIFGTPHACTHVISGYDTTPQGEMLVSTFTSRMHPVYPMSGHVLPVIYSWHLGIEFNELAGSYRGALDPAKLWVAWGRGLRSQGDTFDESFTLWDQAEMPADHVRQELNVPPLDPMHAASRRGAVPGVDYRPTA
jgi:hypothetical protein